MGRGYPWPVLDNAALYGLPGEIVRTIERHSEADRAALLAHVLVTFGAFVGPGPYFEVEATPQPTRLFALIVGDTANARKGTARNRIEHVFRIADEKILEAIRTSGLAGGEGLIEHLSDKQNESGEHVPTEKRRLVQDSEFARILAVAGRDGNTLSAVVRDLWDKGEAGNMTRKNPLKVRGAHVCLTADITLDEFAEKMPGLEIANGLLNRFIIVCSKRSKLLPFGGDLSDADLALVAGKLRDAIDEARTRKRLYMRFGITALRARRIYSAHAWATRLPIGFCERFAAPGRKAWMVVRSTSFLASRCARANLTRFATTSNGGILSTTRASLRARAEAGRASSGMLTLCRKNRTNPDKPRRRPQIGRFFRLIRFFRKQRTASLGLAQAT